jgi:hypothetical protein
MKKLVILLMVMLSANIKAQTHCDTIQNNIVEIQVDSSIYKIVIANRMYVDYTQEISTTKDTTITVHLDQFNELTSYDYKIKYTVPGHKMVFLKNKNNIIIRSYLIYIPK